MPRGLDTPSASALLYLFADQLLERAQWVEDRIRVPCSGTKVAHVAVNQLVYGSAIWHLREAGVVDLVAEGEQLLLHPRVGLDAGARFVAASSMEELLLRALWELLLGKPIPPTTGPVRRLAFRLARVLPKPVDKTRVGVQESEVAEVVRRGLHLGARVAVVARHARTLTHGSLRGRACVEARSGREGEFLRLVASWNEFQSAEGTLYRLLVERAIQGVRDYNNDVADV